MLTALRVAPLFPLLLAVFVAGRAASPPEASAVVELPAFVITETRAGGQPWRYARTEGFEIISQVGDDSTQAVFEALWRGPHLTLQIGRAHV